MSSWTIYIMSGTIVLTTTNSFIGPSRVSTLVIVISVLFIAMVLVAALVGLIEGGRFDIAPVIRAIAFFVLLGLASWFQRLSEKSTG